MSFLDPQVLEVSYKTIIALRIIRTLKIQLLQQDNDKLSKIHQWHLINNLFMHGFTVFFEIPYT